MLGTVAATYCSILTATGTQTVAVTVTDGWGKSNSATQEVTVSAPAG